MQFNLSLSDNKCNCEVIVGVIAKVVLTIMPAQCLPPPHRSPLTLLTVWRFPNCFYLISEYLSPGTGLAVCKYLGKYLFLPTSAGRSGPRLDSTVSRHTQPYFLVFSPPRAPQPPYQVAYAIYQIYQLPHLPRIPKKEKEGATQVIKRI